MCGDDPCRTSSWNPQFRLLCFIAAPWYASHPLHSVEPHIHLCNSAMLSSAAGNDVTSRVDWNLFLGAVVAYYIILALYRLFLHPLARFPGPRLAAISRWYEGYYDVILGGQYTLKIADLHKEYGALLAAGTISRLQ